jgi:two-component system LytT family response regulator
MLQGCDGVVLSGEASNVPEARALLARERPDLVFLDVQMPGENGFALLEGLAEPPAVVFVTAFDHYAVQAFEANAVDYLLKPFRRERLDQALARARRDLARPEELSRRLAELLASLAPAGAGAARAEARGGPALDRLTVRLGHRQLIVRTDDVLWFGAEDKLVFAATADDRHWINFTLDQLERRLDPRRFARVHRGAIVNLDHATALRPGFAGTWKLQLDDPARTEVPVSRARARQLRERLGA